MELEAIELCPYDPNHRIPASRLQYYLASCKKKNPKIAKKMANCKYDACLVVPIKRLKEHEAHCVNRTVVDDEPLNLLKMTQVLKEMKTTPMPAIRLLSLMVWNVDHMHRFPSFALGAFAPEMLVCESDSRDLQEAMAEKHPDSYKS